MNEIVVEFENAAAMYARKSSDEGTAAVDRHTYKRLAALSLDHAQRIRAALGERVPLGYKGKGMFDMTREELQEWDDHNEGLR